jgi:hypothetical protein
MDPEVNSASNEYRPVPGKNLKFESFFMILSSDRRNGKGRYDLYFTGISLP